MKSNKSLVSLVVVLALAVFSLATVSAFGSITSVEVNGVDVGHANASVNIASFAGQTIPVKVIFKATDNATDVRVKASVGDEPEVSTERFDVIAGHVYSRTFAVQMPFDIDPEEDLILEVLVKSKNEGTADEQTITIGGQRESYLVEILDVSLNPNVNAGERLALDIVLKNRGRHLAEDTFVRVKIPALSVEDQAYFGDLSAVDEVDPDREDSAERRMFLNIPSNAKPGVYTLELEAYTSESSTTLTKKVVVGGAEEESTVVSASTSKSFAVEETRSFSLTIVNSGNKVRIYEISAETTSDDLDVDVTEPVVVPAGSSKTVKVDVSADEAGKYTFDVNVRTDGNLVKKQSFSANVEGTRSVVARGTNTTVLLTVVLAIIFVVLLVVLIVLLTRKPEKREFGESYY